MQMTEIRRRHFRYLMICNFAERGEKLRRYQGAELWEEEAELCQFWTVAQIRRFEL